MPIQQMLLGTGAGGGPDLDDVFSIDTYTGNESNRSITTGLNMSGLGGGVWIKDYEYSSKHMLFNTAMGATKFVHPNDGNAAWGVQTNNKTLTSFNSDGFSLGTDNSGTHSGFTNKSGSDTVAWSFVNQDKFFKQVTWTGDGNSTQSITHGLGSTPGFIIARSMSTSSGRDWYTYHKSSGNSKYMRLNSHEFEANFPGWGVGSTTFTARHDFTAVHRGGTASLNASGEQYFAWVFGDESSGGSFGSTGDKKGIVCGQYRANNSDNGPTVTLGFKPGFLIIKQRTGGSSGKWYIFDHVRGLNYPTSGYNQALEVPSESPDGGRTGIDITNTGFTLSEGGNNFNVDYYWYTYIAIPIST